MPYLGDTVPGVFTPVLAKHTKHLSLVDILASKWTACSGISSHEEASRGLEGNTLPDATAKLVVYRAFVEGELDVPEHLGRRVHDLYWP